MSVYEYNRYWAICDRGVKFFTFYEEDDELSFIEEWRTLEDDTDWGAFNIEIF